MTERERHDFTASELTDLRGLHEAAVAALKRANEAVEESIRIQKKLSAELARAIRAAEGLRPTPLNPSDSKISLHDSTRRGMCVCDNGHFRDCPKHFPEG